MRHQARILAALHAELLTKADSLSRAVWRRGDPAAELLADQAAEALAQAHAIEALLVAAGADVAVPPAAQLSLLSLGEP